MILKKFGLASSPLLDQVREDALLRKRFEAILDLSPDDSSLEGLSHDQPAIRLAVIFTVALASPVVDRLASDPNREVRARAQYLLEVARPAVAKALADIRSPEPYIRRRACRLLAEYPSYYQCTHIEGALEDVALHDQDYQVRLAAIFHLPKGHPAIGRCAGDPDSRVRVYVAEKCEDLDVLTLLAEDENPVVRAAVVRCIPVDSDIFRVLAADAAPPVRRAVRRAA